MGYCREDLVKFEMLGMCPSTALVRDPAEVLPKAVYELGVSALNLVHVFGVKRC
jgi:hypothetical protein